MRKTIHFDCRQFKGGIPCEPNKLYDVECGNCEYYEAIDKRILIIKLGAMGDVIRTSPLITAYRNKYPNCHISWLTLTPDILPQNKEIDAIYKWNETSIFTLQNKKFDIAINLDKEEEACILLNLVDAKEKYGFIWKDNHIDSATANADHKLITGLFDHVSKKNTKHYLQEIFEICHLDFNNEEYLINLNEKLAEKWKNIFNEKANGEKVIGLNTGCGNRWLTRLWPEELWVDFINLLQEKGYFPVILGGPQEDEKNQRLAKETKAWYPGTYSLEEFIALTSNLDLVVTQVSMMMHIAVALKRKMLLMYNIFNKHEFYMYGRGVIVEPETGCDCYFGTKCKRERSCMYDIKPSTMLKEAEKLLK
ncbi:MAG: glycosyltransferase family 9 protein [Bacteroidales bacterium]|nr:glycosyltransferase family 9 protein [Bacteroidales bacterium]